MPAVSEKQRRLMAMAEHVPGKIFAKNRGVLKMSKQQLHEFSTTKGLGAKEKALKTVRKAKKGR